MAVETTEDVDADLRAVLAERSIRTVFQPIVELPTRQVVGVEALTRGPRDTALERPDALFAAARAAGLTGELDRLCHDVALTWWETARPPAELRLFLNCEPAGLGATSWAALLATIARYPEVQVVVEITERDLARDPAELLTFTEHLRAAGVGIALDDVGVDADSLALMPFLMPDVVKLDMGMLRRTPDNALVRVLSAVRAHAERRGALVLAEGVETLEHERLAIAFGATLAQGWYYGAARPLPEHWLPGGLPRPRWPLPLHGLDQVTPVGSPYELATARHPAVRVPVDLLIAMRRELEDVVGRNAGLAVVLITCLDPRNTPAELAEHYAALATHARFVGALGADMPAELVPGLRGSALAPGDPIAREATLVVVSPHFAAALVARERRDVHPGERRVFDHVLSYDRTLVVEIARSLMARVLPLADDEPLPEERRSA
ncbi:sensor domain-containing phosphodiesterase [Actinomycetospora chiangmaiensis]|uniref:sensor domain-containing phosphodiesterase n=1 Tax=Actinomycetospora chiangmaiensis TaxID=402650 RepID=UPI000364DB50|nr:EAL domain-containing protein [Actinomycetospora chiangmaiensis]